MMLELLRDKSSKEFLNNEKYNTTAISWCELSPVGVKRRSIQRTSGGIMLQLCIITVHNKLTKLHSETHQLLRTSDP